MLQVRPEAPRDRELIFAVEQSAFGRAAEAELVNRLRDLGQLTYSLVAADGDEVLGHLVLSPVDISDNPQGLRALGLGPVAVSPSHQGRGLGARLIEVGLAAAATSGWDLVFVLGDPAYYRRFDFETAADHGLRWEGEAPPEAFMVWAHKSDLLAKVSGTVRYHPVFNAV